jgi:hypothetical protein
MPDRPTSTSNELIRVAVDPGANGGVVWNEGGKVHAVKMPPTDFDVVDLLVKVACKSALVEIYVEEPPLFTGAKIPGSAVGKMMFNFGIVYGAAIALGWKVHRVRPQAWQKAHPVGTKAGANLTTTAWKNKLKARAAELYPDHSVTLATADALLIYNAAARGAIN